MTTFKEFGCVQYELWQLDWQCSLLKFIKIYRGAEGQKLAWSWISVWIQTVNVGPHDPSDFDDFGFFWIADDECTICKAYSDVNLEHEKYGQLQSH